uniref:Uncharacterized protein n=2 Tax=viral metagenome TaxID=1070528 RepID=A0A6M3LK61_9ZZZZ
MSHWHSLGEIAGLILHGLWQFILEIAPFVDPAPEHGKYPDWWVYYCTYWDWYGHRDGREVPDRHLIECWIRACWGLLGTWIEEVGRWARDEAQNAARSWVGWVQHGYASFSRWIDDVWTRLGQGMVSWAQNAIQALDWLWQRVPLPIRTGLQSWDSIWDGILGKAKLWVHGFYDNLVALGQNAWSWVQGKGQALGLWWDSARGVLDEFRANPWAFIKSKLGPAWDRLTWFESNALTFYSNLWSRYASDLSGFLADPAGWMYDRLESYIERIW